MADLTNDKLRLSILAALSMAATTPAFAQTATTAATTASTTAAKPAGTNVPSDTLDEVVVTASAGDKSKLNTSTSISSIDYEQVKNFDATSTAELYRLIPGIQVAGTQGDGGNSNIGVRGLRTPTGGSPFVQIQEDGLPTVLFGDIQFGNNDYWTHAMPTDERIEAIRGGTAATLASQAIGAVLNHISFTGRNEGGYVELEKGVNYDWTKVNFRFGSTINDTTYYNLGGYYDVGKGIEHAAYNVSNSYAVKGNITKELADDKGFIRLLFKASDTQEPSYNGCISSASLNGKTVGGLGSSPLCDARNQAPGYSALNSGALFSDVSGNLARQPLNGILTTEKMLQLQTHYNIANGVTIDDNARIGRMSGAFDVQFYGAGQLTTSSPTPTSAAFGGTTYNFAPGVNWCTLGSDLQYKAYTKAGGKALSSNGRLGSCLNGSVVGSVIYANGPNAGQVFAAGQYLSDSASVHTNMNHMDHVANDLSVTFKGDLGSSKYDLKLGYFYYSQRIGEDWHSNNSLNEASGKNPAELDFVSSTGNLLSAGGQYGFNAGWNQQFDITFKDEAPYANLNFDIGDLNLDGSVREEFFSGNGYAQGSSGSAIKQASIVQTDPRDPKGQTQVTTTIPVLGYDGAVNAVNFQEHATNWSLGALYKLTPDVSVFARTSKGTRFNADRLTNSNPSYFNGNGSLSSAGLANAEFPVTQQELGLKNRGDLLGGHYTVELTAFYSKYTISSQEISADNCFNILGIHETTCIIAGTYLDKGLELFSTYKVNGFNLLLSGTYDDSKIKSNPSVPYAHSPNIPNWTYTGLFSYDILKQGEVGISLDGQSSVQGGDGNTYPGKPIVGFFAKYRPVTNLQLGVAVYNVFDTFADPGAAGFIDGSNHTLVNAGVAQGVGVKASAKLSF